MELVFTATLSGRGREIFVKKMPVCSIADLIVVLAEKLSGKKDYPIKTVGMREGEQLYESLVSEEEMPRAKEHRGYIIIYPYETVMKKKTEMKINEYRSDQVKQRLSRTEIAKLLKQSGWI